MSVPAPRSIEPLVTAVPRVMVSAPVPPMRVSTLLTVPVLAPFAKVSLLAPAPRSTDIAVVSAVPRVMVSAPVPPVMVSMLETVAVLAKLPKVSVSLPAPRSIEPLATAAREGDGVGAGAADDGLDVGDRDGVGAVCQRELVAAGAEVDGAAGDAGGEGDGVGAGAADEGLDVGDRAGVGGARQGQLVGAGAEVDRHARRSARCPG